MINNPTAPWTFIIDTEQYAGNFERQMAAWITGVIGGCGVGEEAARQARKVLPGTVQTWVGKHLWQAGDSDDSYKRFVSTMPTPGWFNDGYGNHWKDNADPKEVNAAYWKAAQFHFRCEVAALKGKMKDRARAQMAAAKKRGPIKHSAYLSVGILFNTKPCQAILDVMRDQALSFNQVANRDKWLTGLVAITGIRLVERKVVLIEHGVWNG